MVLNLPELTLDLSPPLPPATHPLPDIIFRSPIAIDCNLTELSKLKDFIAGLEEELRKIHAFKRELPLSFLLLTHAIEKLKEEARSYGERWRDGKLDESVRTKSEKIPSEKKTWLSSAQLWNPSDEEDPCKYKEETGACLSIKEDSGSPLSSREEDTEPDLSLITAGAKIPSAAAGPGSRGGGTGGISGSVFTIGRVQASKPETKPPYQTLTRKQRRCWSPELHRRFVDALEKLGGSQVATPKQIRELMQVDGLTNDEVKSHLQKYRLHIRKLPAPRTSTPSSDDVATGQDRLGLGCSIMNLTQSGSPEGPLHLVRSGRCNSASMEVDEDEKSDGHSWRVQHHIVM